MQVGAQAKVRDLVVYASGDGAAIASCRDLFADFAKQSADLGAYGNGSRMKFVANLLVAIHNVASAEAMLLAERAGLDLNQVIEMVAPGAGEFGCDTPLFTTTQPVYAQAMAMGLGDQDTAAVFEVLKANGT